MLKPGGKSCAVYPSSNSNCACVVDTVRYLRGVNSTKMKEGEGRQEGRAGYSTGVGIPQDHVAIRRPPY